MRDAFNIQSPTVGEEVSAESRTLNPEPLFVSQITLSNFRNYESLRLNADKSPVVLTGPNGSGKTNLLEAISLLVPGHGFRHGSLADIQNRATKELWAVATEVRTATGALLIGTGRDISIEEGAAERRVIHIDGRPSKAQSLAEHIALAWITPDMDRLLIEGASARRKFLDRLASNFDPAHGTYVRAYEKAMRERLRLLRENTAEKPDALWLSALEDEMAKAAVAIAAARKHMVARLGAAIDEGGDVFPRADIEVHGIAEDMLESGPALLVEDALRAAFAGSREEDMVRGTCSTGAHRSDLHVRHRQNGCPADLCSTGEQKALVIALMLAYVRLLADARRMTPLFLLDDIVSHLDDVRRRSLFDEILSLGCQAWFTGTDAETFAPVSSSAQMFCVENGTVTL